METALSFMPVASEQILSEWRRASPAGGFIAFAGPAIWSSASRMAELSISTSPSSITSVGTRISGLKRAIFSPSPKTDHGRCSNSMPVEPHRDGDAPDERAVELADENHETPPDAVLPATLRACTGNGVKPAMSKWIGKLAGASWVLGLKAGFQFDPAHA